MPPPSTKKCKCSRNDEGPCADKAHDGSDFHRVSFRSSQVPHAVENRERFWGKLQGRASSLDAPQYSVLNLQAPPYIDTSLRVHRLIAGPQ